MQKSQSSKTESRMPFVLPEQHKKKVLYQVEALPTLILFNKGEVIERYIGYMTADELEYAVQTTLNRLAQAPPM